MMMMMYMMISEKFDFELFLKFFELFNFSFLLLSFSSVLSLSLSSLLSSFLLFSECFIQQFFSL